MKNIYTVRVPTQEQYAFIEARVEGTQEEAVAEYNELTRLVKTGEGISTKDFNDVLDCMIKSEPVRDGTELYSHMNRAQQWMVQELKKALARTNK